MMIRPIASGLHQNSTTFKLLVFHTVLLWLVTSWSSDSWFVLIPDWFWSSPFRALSSKSFSRIVNVVDFVLHVTKQQHCGSKYTTHSRTINCVISNISFTFSRAGSFWLLIYIPRPANVPRHFYQIFWFSLVVSMTIATNVTGVLAHPNICSVAVIFFLPSSSSSSLETTFLSAKTIISGP